MTDGIFLKQQVALSAVAVLGRNAEALSATSAAASPVLVLLAAGRGTRFGTAPKCVQPVRGQPLARHTIEAFGSLSAAPAIVVVGYAHEEVMARLGNDNIYVKSSNSTGGTAWAAYEALSVPGLLAANPLLLISMGDRVIPETTQHQLLAAHTGGGEADLTILTARHAPPGQHGKGRIVRDCAGRLLQIVEQRDIDAIADPLERQRLDAVSEANCPLYAARAQTLHRHLGAVRNANAQGQYYFTDIIAALATAGGEVRTITVGSEDREYPILCADVTRPPDLSRLESLLATDACTPGGAEHSVRAAAAVLAADRAPGQTAAIAAQLRELWAAACAESSALDLEQPVALAVAGGRFRIAFMHPDMGRFYGPAWQMPIGAATAVGREQLVLLAQQSDDGRIHHLPLQDIFREKITSVAADEPAMFPSEQINSLARYETFGTRLAEQLLLSLGYFSDAEIRARRAADLPLPPHALWVSNSMRRPFALICNAIASLRTVRDGPVGARVQEALGRDGFRGLRIISTGALPQGGFASSSALTVAIKNALNVLYGFGLPSDTLVHLACQAEYGTGVRAGSLDQATEQKGKYGQGALISSNPRDNYRTLGIFPVPSERIHFLFPYSVDRDREAWRWSAGAYSESAETAIPTPPEMRKLTGKAAEIAALLLGLPADQDFFMLIERDLLRTGVVGAAAQREVYALLRRLPLLIPAGELRARLRAAAPAQAEGDLAALFGGWREPSLRRGLPDGRVVSESGVPLRAMVAYLFVEMARCFRLIHEPQRWIEHVTRSQRGDCSFAIDTGKLPAPDTLCDEMPWERGLAGAARLAEWLRRCDATPFDYNRDLDDATLAAPDPRPLHELRGGSFFRGLALLDLAEALLKRAFGDSAVALRVNAAGQGDFFQVHVDSAHADAEQVKWFLDRAFYARFGLRPAQRYVETHPGGGAVGVRLERCALLPDLIAALQTTAGEANPPA